jgi:hypothetical protein
LVAGAGAVMVGADGAVAQTGPSALPTAITTPPRAPTVYFWDPDVIAVDPQFNGLMQANTAIRRLHTGMLWAEGPAWSAQGRYLLWSDISNNRQIRWSEDDGRVSMFFYASNYSNGNTFDFQGRQLSCEHLTRRVVRYEHEAAFSPIMIEVALAVLPISVSIIEASTLRRRSSPLMVAIVNSIAHRNAQCPIGTSGPQCLGIQSRASDIVGRSAISQRLSFSSI